MDQDAREKARAHSRKSAETIRKKYGDDYFSRIGKRGSEKSRGEIPVVETIPDRTEELAELQARFAWPTLESVSDAMPTVCTACLEPSAWLAAIWRLGGRAAEVLAGKVMADATWCSRCLSRFVSNEQSVSVMVVPVTAASDDDS